MSTEPSKMQNHSPIDPNGYPPPDEPRLPEVFILNTNGAGGYDSPTRGSIYKAHHIALVPVGFQSMQTLQYPSSQEDLYYDPQYQRQSFRPPPLPKGKSNLSEPAYPYKDNDKVLIQETRMDDSPTPLKMERGPLPPPPQVRMSPVREVIFVAVVALAHFMTQAALGQALVPLDIIGETFGTRNIGEMSWYVAGYSLTVGTFILISGRMGDIIGHKRMFVFGYTWFGVWSAFSGFAAYPRHQIFFDICRAMQGIGPAIIMPCGLALFGKAYPPGVKKNIVFSIFGAVAPAGFVVGAVSGSLFAELVWWPWAFWTFALACWGLAAVSIMVIPRELSERPFNPPGFDFRGSALGVIGLILFNVAWNNAPMYGWGSPTVYIFLILGILALVAFVWFEKRARYPILPLEAINGTVLFVLACVGLGWGAFGVWVFYVFRFLETVRNYSALAAAATFGPAPICGLLAAGLTGFMLTHTPVSFTMMIAMFAFCGGIVITATQPAQQTYWAQLFVSVVIMPFGMDMSFPAASVILSNKMPPEHQGLAGSLVNTVVNYSISIALGIAGTVEVNVAKPVPGMQVHSEAFMMSGYRAAWYTACGLSGLGVVCGVLFFINSFRKEGWKVMDH